VSPLAGASLAKRVLTPPPSLPPCAPCSAYIDGTMTGVAMGEDGHVLNTAEAGVRPMAMHAFDQAR
jgi:hypothetical protein